MGAADAVLAHFNIIYFAVLVGIKAYEVVYEVSFSIGFRAIMSTTLMFLIFVTTLTWDLLCKAIDVYANHHSHHHTQEMCKGGICWHGVAENSPAAHLRFDLPDRLPVHGIP